MKRLALVVIVLLMTGTASAQMQVDTVRGDASVPDSGAFHMTKSPLLALGLSAVLPGAGQIYNEEWWKVPILYAFVGGFGYGAYIQNQRYQDSKVNLARAEEAKNANDISKWRRSRDFFRNDRDRWLVYLGLAYIANLLDAYISAHLYDFDVSDPVPVPETSSQFRVGVRIPF